MCDRNRPCVVLFAEDDRGIQDVLKSRKRELLEQGINLLYVPSVRETKQSIIEQEITILLLDLNLTDSTGKQTLLEIAPLVKQKRIPFFVFSGLDDPEIFAYAKEMGAAEVFIKGDMSLMNMVIFAVHAANETRKAQRLETAYQQLESVNQELATLLTTTQGQLAEAQENYEALQKTIVASEHAEATETMNALGNCLEGIRQSFRQVASSH